MSKKQYYGTQRIDSKQKDGDHIILKFPDGEDRLSQKLFDVSITNSPIETTELWDKQAKIVVRDLLKILLDYDVKLKQLDYFLTKLRTSIEENLARANDNLWGKTISNRRMSDVDLVLTKEFIRVFKERNKEESN